MDLRYYDGGYYGYLSEDVRMVFGDMQDKAEAMVLVDKSDGVFGFNSVEVGILGLGVLGPASFFNDVKLNNLPVYADEAAAVTAGLAQHRVYKTPTGELRIKL